MYDTCLSKRSIELSVPVRTQNFAVGGMVSLDFCCSEEYAATGGSACFQIQGLVRNTTDPAIQRCR